MARRLDIEDPPENWSLSVARKIEKAHPLDREIIHQLVARPRRFAELQPLLRRRGKNNLTQALKRLRMEGVIQMRTRLRPDPPVDYYELTSLGASVAMILAGREYFEFLSTHAGAPDHVPAADS